MQRPVCLTDFEVHFKNSLNKNALDYYSSGANQEQTLKDNMEAFTRYVSTVILYMPVAVTEIFLLFYRHS